MFEVVKKVKKKSENRTGIPMQLKERMEQNTGMSLDDVRVHYNSALPARLDALAYTQGNRVEIGPGQEQHLPHELGHVVQQKLGIVRANERHPGGAALNTDPKLEHQADEIGAGRSSLFAQQDTKQGFETVVQRHPFDIFELIHGLLAIIPRGAQNIRENLVKIESKSKIDDADIKSIRALLGDTLFFSVDTRKKINELFFHYYDMEVEHDLNIYKKCIRCEGIDDENVMNRDESCLIDALNDIYATPTGKELLVRLAANKAKHPKKGTTIYLEHRDAPSKISKGNNKDEELRRNEKGKYIAGPGAGVYVALGSQALDDIYKVHEELMGMHTIVLAHELIHALHAQMGIKPTWSILLGNKNALQESDCQKNFKEKYSQFHTCEYPDDVPTTGIVNNIVYPKPLEEIKHINENQIRKELNLEPRTEY